MKRGEIWWAELEPPAGRRPVLLLSRDEAYIVRGLITVTPVTTRVRHIPSEVPLGLEDGLPKSCVVNLDNITTIAKASLNERLSILSTKKQIAVEDALRFALGLKT
ncbi:MAG: type II toxin-antitoxin system PemK/MazF family toxin [Dehalococcoidales bacterium]|jgi:mRNA interferase MazF|nr:type II toxin-antitoxin system PemK/MazF family toxin [Dehalococcoidales bacterium]MDD3265288.1 type II toxin-antitoxin system PemK/MazF family toxin [Dehalococcoidales bacterium]MDD4323079.1 type II toxin-antitoxin system PemK/MazF family toxin [Dehalococcoidales bacterium]MDD4794441.1 type II toxin-antitoxin system PemK/MazF family toxin [Dehalococcoidales bacterium]MDD5122862.1 type II toxin-antitoxin system PemK/MazF family toxin [Dehalococcoidales bacterium]